MTALSHFPFILPALDGCLSLVDETFVPWSAYHPTMPLTSTPQNIVIVAVEGENTFTVVNRDNGEVLLSSDDHGSKTARNKKAGELSKLTGWPVVDHA